MSTSALCVKLCLTDLVWVNQPKRTSIHDRLYPLDSSYTLFCRAERVSLRERVLGVVLFFFLDVALVLCVCGTLSVCRAFSFFCFFGCSPGTYVSTYTADTTLVHTEFQRYVYWYPATRYIRADTRYVRILVFSPVKRRLLHKKFARTRVSFFGGILDVALYCT